VSIKDGGLRAKLKSPEEIQDLDFYKIRGATLEIQNTIFVLEELLEALEELSFAENYNLQAKLQPNIRFIFGPPGTGKTTYLAHEEIRPMMLSDVPLKILVLTPTNKAADVLVKKVQHFCGDSPEWLMRFGTTSEMSIENAGLLRDSSNEIPANHHFCVVTTMARFPYDGFNQGADEFKFKNILWDIIIIDEASMIGVAYIAYALHQQRQAQFIIGGDPFQIAPVVFAEDWKDENIYTMVGLDTFDPVLQRERLQPFPYPITNLGTQYRSVHSIGQLYSYFAYNGILKHKRQQIDKKAMKLPDLPLKDINIIQFPVNNLELIFKPQLLYKSHYHLYSALLTVELLKYIAQQLHQHHKKEKWRLGVICPYKAQATLVTKVLDSLHLNFKNITIQSGTIHSFQGDECDVVVCLFNPPQHISKSPNSFLNQKNIINVAISRARDYVILLMPDGDTPKIENLYQMTRLQGIMQYYLKGNCATWQAADIEEIIFGQRDYLYENTFTTTHQSVNVYTQPEKKYEIRIEEEAVDVQVTT
jgi:AAA domain